MNDPTDTEKMTLLRRMLRLRVSPDVLLVLLISAIDPLAARLLMMKWRL